MRKALLASTLLAASTALGPLGDRSFAQTRQPAQITTNPAATPQTFDLLDKSGVWMGLGAASNGAFQVYGAGGMDVRAAGCKSDGTDQAACIRAALASTPGCVLIPDTQAGFLVKSTIVVKTCLKGQHVSTINANPTFTYPGASAILCDVGVNGVCVDAATANSLSESPQIESLTIGGIAGTPPAGSIGLRVPGGYNSRFKSVAVFNFDNCVVVGPTGSAAPINANFTDLNLGRCQSHYFTIDGAPEVKVNGGRFGLNGSGNLNALDFVYLTKTTTLGAGGGPNTVQFNHVQFTATVQCAIRWGGWTGTGGAPGLFWFTNAYFEWHADYGGTQGVFCSDATVPQISQLFVSRMATSLSGATVPLFALDAATTPNQWWFDNNLFSCAGTTLHTRNPGSGVASNLHFSNNSFCSPVSFIADTASAEVYLDHNHLGNLSISGSWGSLAMNGNTWASLADTATGNVESTAFAPQTFTPVLKFAGVEPADIAYASRTGLYARNTAGGFDVSVGVTLSNKGTASAGDAVTISGFPLSCTGGKSAPVFLAGGFTGLTGAPFGWVSTSVLGLGQSTATGVAQLTYAAFTNTTTFNFSGQCGRAL